MFVDKILELDFHIYAYPYDVLTCTLKYEDFIRNLNKKLLYLTVVRNNITLKCKQCEVLLNFTTFISFCTTWYVNFISSKGNPPPLGKFFSLIPQRSRKILINFRMIIPRLQERDVIMKWQFFFLY